MGKSKNIGVGNPGHKHGKWKSPEWNSWDHMKRRCNNPNDTKYKNYGANGISVCARWLMSFELFYEDMGDRPVGTSLDRYPNKNGNYEPGNCRWATPIEQSRNTNKNRFIAYKGETLCVAEWAQKFGVASTTIISRFERGVDISVSVRVGRKFGWRRKPVVFK